MKSKTFLLLLLVVVLPTALLSWGGYQLAQQQSYQIESQVKKLLRDQLTELDTRIERYFSVGEARMQVTTSRDFRDLDSIREIVENQGVIENLFIITPSGALAYPNPNMPLNRRELAFYNRIRTIVEDGEIQNQILQSSAAAKNYSNPPVVTKVQPNLSQAEPSQPDNQLDSGQDQRMQSPVQTQTLGRGGSISRDNDRASLYSQQTLPEPPTDTLYETCSGWFIWYWGPGVNLIYWQRKSNGVIVCAALERSRWMSDLINELPDTVVDQDPGRQDLSPAGVRSTRIVNANGEPVYQWGSDVEEEMILAAEVPVSHPLTSWKLQMWVLPAELKSPSVISFNILLGIMASSLALIAVASVFVREYSKEIKEASRRVSFVNQVSHELRTPLTNIRMYAELLDGDLDRVGGEDAEKARGRVQVIDSESERLSRLIGNVLTFAGSQKNRLQLHVSPGVVDDCVQQTLSGFQPNLEKLGIELRLRLDATSTVKFDNDALGQIIGNLISNVEKYASGGDYLEISTRQQPNITRISIQDDGEGIDPIHAEKIFEPFWRRSNQLQHASGTGIGLSISRELARLHGGNLFLDTESPRVPAGEADSPPRGARFVIEIKTETVS